MFGVVGAGADRWGWGPDRSRDWDVEPGVEPGAGADDPDPDRDAGADDPGPGADCAAAAACDDGATASAVSFFRVAPAVSF